MNSCQCQIEGSTHLVPAVLPVVPWLRHWLLTGLGGFPLLPHSWGHAEGALSNSLALTDHFVPRHAQPKGKRGTLPWLWTLPCSQAHGEKIWGSSHHSTPMCALSVKQQRRTLQFLLLPSLTASDHALLLELGLRTTEGTVVPATISPHATSGSALWHEVSDQGLKIPHLYWICQCLSPLPVAELASLVPEGTSSWGSFSIARVATQWEPYCYLYLT